MNLNAQKCRLQGPVRSIQASSVTLLVQEGITSEELQSTQISVYDKAGYLIEDSHYSSGGTLLHKVAYAYDLKNRLIEQIIYDENDLPTFKTIYSYDANGSLLEQKFYGSDGSVTGSQQFNHSSKGLRFEEETMPFLEGDGSVSYHIDTNLDDFGLTFSARSVHSIRKILDTEGNPIEFSLHNIRGSRTGKVFFAYDDESRIIEIEQYGRSGFCSSGELTKWQRILEPLLLRLLGLFLVLKCVYGFIVRGEMKKAARCIFHGPLLVQMIYVYDSEGRKIEEQACFIRSVLMKKVFTYDDRGEKIEEIEYRGDNSVAYKQSYRYEYDASGNWIKQTISGWLDVKEAARDSKMITSRTISYYSH